MDRYGKTGRLAAALLWVGAAIAQQPPQIATAFPGALGKKVRESERVVIWEFIPAPGPLPLHHTRDAVVVAFTNLKPRVAFVPRGTVHLDEQTTGADRAYVFEVK